MLSYQTLSAGISAELTLASQLETSPCGELRRNTGMRGKRLSQNWACLSYLEATSLLLLVTSLSFLLTFPK